MKNKKVWFVTGCSKGLGHALVNELLEQGYMVSATSRNKQALIEAFGNESEQFLPLSMNLADEESVKTALKKTVLKFGRVDVVVNNAGYTHLATIEEMSDGGEVLAVTNGRQALRLVLMEKNARYVPVRE